MVSFELLALPNIDLESELFGIQINLSYMFIAAHNTDLSCYQTPNDKVGRSSSGVLPTERWLVALDKYWLILTGISPKIHDTINLW